MLKVAKVMKIKSSTNKIKPPLHKSELSASNYYSSAEEQNVLIFKRLLIMRSEIVFWNTFFIVSIA